MTKEKTVKESKNYLISVHDTLRRMSRQEVDGKPFIDAAMEQIEAGVKQLEAWEETTKLPKTERIDTTTEE